MRLSYPHPLLVLCSSIFVPIMPQDHKWTGSIDPEEHCPPMPLLVIPDCIKHIKKEPKMVAKGILPPTVKHQI